MGTKTAFPFSINIEEPSFICLDLHLFCSPLFLIISHISQDFLSWLFSLFHFLPTSFLLLSH
jgi:hypothetical protein